MDEDALTILIVILSIVSITFFVSWLYAFDNVDLDDVIGPYLCQQHGLEFESVEQEGMMFGTETEIEDMVLKIYCRNNNDTSISDGYLLIKN